VLARASAEGAAVEAVMAVVAGGGRRQRRRRSRWWGGDGGCGESGGGEGIDGRVGIRWRGSEQRGITSILEVILCGKCWNSCVGGFDQGKCLYLFHMGEAHGYKADKGLGVGAPKAGRTREGEAREARG